jgi:hypothetical protein
VTPQTALIVLAAVLLVGYVASVFLFPRTRCRRCKTTGRNHQPFFPTRNYRMCKKCKGRGWHVRPMRRFLGGPSTSSGAGVWQGP